MDPDSFWRDIFTQARAKKAASTKKTTSAPKKPKSENKDKEPESESMTEENKDKIETKPQSESSFFNEETPNEPLDQGKAPISQSNLKRLKSVEAESKGAIVRLQKKSKREKILSESETEVIEHMQDYINFYKKCKTDKAKKDFLKLVDRKHIDRMLRVLRHIENKESRMSQLMLEEDKHKLKKHRSEIRQILQPHIDKDVWRKKIQDNANIASAVTDYCANLRVEDDEGSAKKNKKTKGIFESDSESEDGDFEIGD